MKKVFASLHLWLAWPFGLLISLLCATGAILIFESEIQEVMYPSRYKAEIIGERRLTPEEVIERMGRELPDAEVVQLTIPADPSKNYRLGFEGEGRRAHMVDPYTGAITGMHDPHEKGTFFSFIRRAHRWFFFPYSRGEFSWGKIINGVGTIIFTLALITGLVIWIPRTWRLLKMRLKIKTGSGAFRFWYDSHLALGLYAAVFLLGMSLTGPTWSFPWYRKGFMRVIGIEEVQVHRETGGGEKNGAGGNEGTQRGQGVPGGEKVSGSASSVARENTRGGGSPAGRQGRSGGGRPGEATPVDFRVWTSVLNELVQRRPDYRTITIRDGSAAVTAGTWGNSRASDTYQFDRNTGSITGVDYYRDRNPVEKVQGWLFSLHTGTWGGVFSKILYFAATLIGTSLPLTGYYIWYKKRRRSRPRKK